MTTLTVSKAAPTATELLAVKLTATAMGVFGFYGFATGAPSTVSYLLSVLAIGFVIARLRRAPIPAPLAIALAVSATVHLAGGLVRVGDDVLYNASIGPYIGSLHTHVLQYDHFGHAFSTCVGALMVWMLLIAPLRVATDRRETVVLCLLAGLGIGALNEMIEFLTTIAHHGAGVGGYNNTGWDLVANTIGAVTAAAIIQRTNHRVAVPA